MWEGDDALRDIVLKGLDIVADFVLENIVQNRQMLLGNLIQIRLIHVVHQSRPSVDKWFEGRHERQPVQLAGYPGIVLQYDISKGFFQQGALHNNGVCLQLLASVLALDITHEDGVLRVVDRLVPKMALWLVEEWLFCCLQCL